MKIFSENPVFRILLGMCPTLAVTTSAINGLGMGLATTLVLTFSNLFISLLRNIIPDKIRIPAFIVVIVTFVSIVDMVMAAYFPDLHKALGVFIKLIVVNCIILGRAEAFASKNNPWLALGDGFGNGIAFTVALLILGTIRELIGNGSLFNFAVLPHSYIPVLFFILPPGAFLVLGLVIAVVNRCCK